MTEKQMLKEYLALREKIMAEVILEARKVMKKKPSLTECFIVMGSFFFYHPKNDDNIHPCDIPCAKKLQRIYETWNSEFKIDGEGIRFTATGPVITNW